MERKYKLSANFNTVEIEFDENDLLDFVDEDEWQFDEDEGGALTHSVPEDVLIHRLLQKEYDLLAGIKTVAPVAVNQAAPVERPSDKQIEWASNLGMKNPESRSKKEVWEFIQKNK